MANEQYKEIFLSEAREILGKLNNNLVLLEKDARNPEVIDEIFRAAHTLKGMSATMGYDPLVKLSHTLESDLDLVRSQKINVDTKLTDLLFEAADALDEGVKLVAKDKLEKFNADVLVEKLKKISGNGQEPASVSTAPAEVCLLLSEELKNKIAEAAKQGLIAWQISFSLSKECTLCYPRSMVVLQHLQDLGEILDYKKLVDGLKTKNEFRRVVFYFLSAASENEIREHLNNIPEIEAVKLSLCQDGQGIPAMQKPKEAGEAVDKGSVRVKVEQLDKLMNLVGELTLSKSRLGEVSKRLSDEELNEVLGYFNRQSSDLQVEMMDIRLFPLEYIFANFPRLVRDTARNENKEVDLLISGQEIGLDRIVLDEINEPLIHILRNSISHGIELPDAREKAGKSKRGVVKLSASRERNSVIIEVADDGAGMDPEAIKKLALEKGLVTTDEAKALSREEIFRFVCSPNFSTSQKADETSGRGVGMNVVKKAVDSLGGVLNIESELGKGTTFRLHLPLSLAIIQALLVDICQDCYALPLSSVRETIKLRSDQIKKIGTNEQMINYRDQVVPVINVCEMFGSQKKDEKEVLSMVVVEFGGKKVALVVDRLRGEQEVVVKELREPIKGVRGISGATILGSGRVAFILDVSSLLT